MKKILRIIKNNFGACLCFALAAAVALSGSLSYARYAHGASGGNSATSGSFAYSTSIDAVSALSFTNTAFWGGSSPSDLDDADKVAMNALRSIDFSVNNFETPGGKPSEVALKYTLCFSAPANFVEKLAIQLFDEDAGTAMLPQIVMSDLLNTPGGGEFDTSDSYAYNGTETDDLTFRVQTSGNTLIATAGDVCIRVEKSTANLRQTLLFRLWDTSQLHLSTITYESGLLLPPMEAKLNVDVDIYRVSISMDALVLQPGSAMTRHHAVRLAPTDILNDDYLGGTLFAQGGGNLTQFGAGGNYLLRTVKEQVTDDGVPGAVHTVFGTPTVYEAGQTVTEEITKGAHTEQLTAAQTISTRTYTATYGEVCDALSWPASGTTYYNNNWQVVPKQNQATYQLEVASDSTVSVTETVRVEAGSTAAYATRIYELCTPTSVTKTDIDLNVVRVTEKTATYSGTIIIERTYKLTDYTLRKKGNGNSWSTYSGTFGASTNFPTYADTDTQSAYGPIALTPENVSITRHIKRIINEVNFTPESVTRVDDEKNSYNYTSTAPLELIEGGTQIFYISQCYSKSYPLEIDVLFEQAIT